MKRGGPIKRRTRLRPRRKTPRRSARQRDTEYMLRVKQLPCCAAHGHFQFSEGRRWLVYQDCHSGEPVEAHHAGEHAAGRKASDDTCIPLCTGHHRAWHDHRAPFKNWDAARRRHWADARIAETQAKLRPRTFAEDLAF